MRAEEAKRLTDKTRAELNVEYDARLKTAIEVAEYNIKRSIAEGRYVATVATPSHRETEFASHFESLGYLVVRLPEKCVLSWYNTNE